MTTGTRKRYGDSSDPAFSIGDLVTVEGYPDLIYEVEAYTHARHIYADHEFHEMVYDMGLVWGDENACEWLEAYSDDLRLVSKAADADEWLRKHKRRMKRKYTDVDAVLDKLSDFVALRDMFGDCGRRRYGKRIAALKERIRRATV